MDIPKKIDRFRTPNFYSSEMIITKKSLNENQLKYTYQKQLISNLDFKHKEWSKFIDGQFLKFSLIIFISLFLLLESFSSLNSANSSLIIGFASYAKYQSMNPADNIKKCINKLFDLN